MYGNTIPSKGTSDHQHTRKFSQHTRNKKTEDFCSCKTDTIYNTECKDSDNNVFTNEDLRLFQTRQKLLKNQQSAKVDISSPFKTTMQQLQKNKANFQQKSATGIASYTTSANSTRYQQSRMKLQELAANSSFSRTKLNQNSYSITGS